MGSHPLNLAIRFVLEVIALGALAYWGWTQHTGVLRPVLTLGLPIVAAALWGIFAVAGDPSRSGDAPVAVPGIVRLILEWALLGGAVWALVDAGAIRLSWILGASVLLHYVASYDRIRWLIKQ